MVHSELYGTVKATFDQEGWAYTEVEDREVLTAGFEAHHTRVALHVQVFEAFNAVSVVSESVLSTGDPLKRDRLAELVMRVNHQLTIGAFELEWDMGRIIFRASNLFPTPQGDTGVIATLVHNTIREMDRISPVEALIHRSEGPELAGINIPELLERSDLLPEVEPLSE